MRLALGSLAWLGLVLAHSEVFHNLADVRLCIDARSVQLSIDKGDAFPDVSFDDNQVKKAFEERLKAILNSYQVPFEEKAQCNDRGFLLSLFHVKPERQAGLEAVYLFVASTQVGLAPASFNPFDRYLEEGSYDDYESWLMFPGDIIEINQFMPLANERMILELAAYWWEDNPSQRPSLLPQTLGLILIAMIALLGLIYRKKRRGS